MPTPNTGPQIVRLPLVGGYNHRLIVDNGASYAASGIIGLGVVGSMIIGASSTSANKDRRYVNAVPDKTIDPYTKEEHVYLYKRPGVATHTTPASGSKATALRVWTGQGSGDKVMSAFGDTNSTIYDGTTSKGTITGIARDITETTVGSTATIVIPVSNSKAYYYQDGGAITEITDTDYPGNAGKSTTGTFVHLDGYSFILTTDGLIYNSDLNSITAWSATSYISAGMYPDLGVGLARYKNSIVAFGKETIEFFENVGNATGSPLRRMNDKFIRLGCIGQESICQFEDNVAFVASSDIGNASVYIIDDYRPKRISTNTIDTQILARGSTTVYVTSAKLYGKTFIYVIIGTNTFVYCIEDDTWHEWSGQVIRWHKFAANTSATPVVYSISRDSTAGKVYKMNHVTPVFTDDGDSYTFTVQTNKFDAGTEKRKFLSRLTVVGDVGSASSSLNILWSDDDYGTWSTARTVNLTSNRKYLANCGSFRRRAFRLTNSDNVPIRIEALELEFKEGMH